MSLSLNDLIALSIHRTSQVFELYIKNQKLPASLLQEAVYYSISNGGKRIRPLLVYATGHTLNLPFEILDAPAAAVELIHSYSLIHDDLPAMDNADLRRGKPSCHKAYNEAIAILAGDALQPLAFQVLATHPSSLSCNQRLSMIAILAEACGMNGMVAGQALDMEAIPSYESLNQMHSLKTGALLEACTKLALAASLHNDKTIDTALTTFAKNIGLGFQVQDDLLDLEATTETLGKSQGLDKINQKITFPALLGVEKTKAIAETLFKNAKECLHVLGAQANLLHELTEYIFQRKK